MELTFLFYIISLRTCVDVYFLCVFFGMGSHSPKLYQNGCLPKNRGQPGGRGRCTSKTILCIGTYVLKSACSKMIAPVRHIAQNQKNQIWYNKLPLELQWEMQAVAAHTRHIFKPITSFPYPIASCLL